MKVALLDVNVLVALFYERHIHHDVAHDWFADNTEGGWASCPLTENGLLRIIGNPTRIDTYVAAARAADLLGRFCAHSVHHFWPETLSFRDEDLFDLAECRGHQQLTDIYLLGLAVKNDARFVTFDRGIPLRAVKGSRPDHLDVIAPMMSS